MVEMGMDGMDYIELYARASPLLQGPATYQGRYVSMVLTGVLRGQAVVRAKDRGICQGGKKYGSQRGLVHTRADLERGEVYPGDGSPSARLLS